MSPTIRHKYKYFHSTVQRAKDRRQKLHFCRLPFDVTPRVTVIGEFSHAELLQPPTHSESKWRNLTFLANEEAHNFLRSQQANRRSWPDQLFRINCPIIYLWNKQSLGAKLPAFLGRHQRIHRESKESKPKKKTEHDINVFFKFTECLGEVGWLHQKNHRHTLCALG